MENTQECRFDPHARFHHNEQVNDSYISRDKITDLGTKRNFTEYF